MERQALIKLIGLYLQIQVHYAMPYYTGCINTCLRDLFLLDKKY
jgi:hypothetical protein